MELWVNNKILSDKVKLCRGFSKFMGLMFFRKLRNKESFVLVNASDIHMFFVFQSIDAVWLDKNRIVVDKKENVKPFTPLIKPKIKSHYVIELPLGKAKLFKLKDRVNFR